VIVHAVYRKHFPVNIVFHDTENSGICATRHD